MIYECHITLPLSQAEAGEKIAKELHWKTSEIARDPLLGQASYFYLTSHHNNIWEMESRMQKVVATCRAQGLHVIREKIELIIHDVRY